MAEIRVDIVSAIGRIRSLLDLQDPQVQSDWAQVETFTAISLAVLAKTNPSKIRSEAMTVEIRARMDGKKCLE